MIRPVNRRLTAAVAVAAALTLAACGSSGSASTASSTAAATPGGADVPGIPPGGGGDGSDRAAQFEKIQQCLEAAGVDAGQMPGGGARASGAPSGPPPGLPSDGTRPSGAPSGFPGGGFTQSAEVTAALEACGLSMPSGPGGAGPGGDPTASPSAG